MISSIQKKLEKIGGRMSNNLSFLKYNTPLSGRGVGCKVIFFIFEGKNNYPKAIAKTVRMQRDAEVIRKGYKNMKLLNQLTEGTSFAQIFPEMLFIYDDGSEIFTVETVCSGSKMSRESGIEGLLKTYTAFSKHVAQKSSEKIILNYEYAKMLIEEFKSTSNVIGDLLKYSQQLWTGDAELPLAYQHGDLTIDNVLIDNGAIRIIDCDTFSNVAVPGFDIFHLTTRKKMRNSHKILEDYFKELSINYIPDKKLLFIYFLHELYIKRDYILMGRTAENVISEFENMVKSYYSL